MEQVSEPAASDGITSEMSPLAGVVTGVKPVHVITELVPPTTSESTVTVIVVSGRLWNATRSPSGQVAPAGVTATARGPAPPTTT